MVKDPFGVNTGDNTPAVAEMIAGDKVIIRYFPKERAENMGRTIMPPADGWENQCFEWIR